MQKTNNIERTSVAPFAMLYQDGEVPQVYLASNPKYPEITEVLKEFNKDACTEVFLLPLSAEALHKEVLKLEAEVYTLDNLCNRTYVAQGADAYNYACERMETYQEARAVAGKEIGTQGSLCDGLEWVYSRLDSIENINVTLGKTRDFLQDSLNAYQTSAQYLLEDNARLTVLLRQVFLELSKEPAPSTDLMQQVKEVISRPSNSIYPRRDLVTWTVSSPEIGSISEYRIDAELCITSAMGDTWIFCVTLDRTNNTVISTPTVLYIDSVTNTTVKVDMQSVQVPKKARDLFSENQTALLKKLISAM